jgi:hypothetical protein
MIELSRIEFADIEYQVEIRTSGSSLHGKALVRSRDQIQQNLQMYQYVLISTLDDLNLLGLSITKEIRVILPIQIDASPCEMKLENYAKFYYNLYHYLFKRLCFYLI